MSRQPQGPQAARLLRDVEDVINTVTTPLTGDWTDLTAIWYAASPPATDGETITVQPADGGDAHAIVIVQAAAEPAAGERGHLVTDGAVLRLTRQRRPPGRHPAVA